MQIKEVMDKTGVVIAGLVVAVSEYVSKNGKSYWSCDMNVKGCRQAVNIRLPQGFPVNTLQEYELAKLAVTVRPNFARNGIELEAVIPAK